MSHPPPNEPPEPDEPSRDALWALLNRARKVPASPDFTHRVMAAVHAEQTARHTRWAWLHQLFAPSLRPALAGAAVALLLAGAWMFQSHHSPDRTATTLPAAATAPNDDSAEEIVQALASDLALLEDVDHLLDPEDGLDLDEEDVRRLLF